MRPTLLYDADCGFCTRAAAKAPGLRLEVEVTALQSVDLAALGVSAERAVTEMPFLRADGSIVYGHRAIAAALGTGPAPLRVLGRIITAPGVEPVADLVYGWVARHRQQLPGGTPACAIPTTERSGSDD
ncbi:MAG TPA: DCC1-like thiol-disulfide oxidoreductase family protein [Flexivirga sp.]|uniref:thiol-disulfide oxidoreductase DCC family protein n=1 Tax=Flexivirga sp. TaxID=1962927 RepID=UPI002B77602A|nr:DCC1-like thiol-disulfide oxidoreductase family protein [Flexivirga sp.]HWC22162.1 DCC1-like thiol-disulfide oxidoreductase family protein [Flexivirga sp.]